LTANRFRQTFISRKQLAVQLLRERDVCGIVGREVRSELEHPTKQRLMSVTEERQIQVILEGIRGTHSSEPSCEQAPPKSCCDLDVTERRGVEVDFGRLQDALNLARAVRL
jgi:hypothetical protein